MSAPAQSPPPSPPSAPPAPISTDITTGTLHPSTRLIVNPPMSYTRKVLIAVGISVAAILLTILIYSIAQIIILCFAGVLLAVFISAPSNLLAKYGHMKRMHALVIVLAILFLTVVGGGYFMGYTVYQQTRQLVQTVPVALKQFEAGLVDILPGKSLEEPPIPPATSPATLPGDLSAIEPTALATAPASQPAATHPVDEASPRAWIADRLIAMREAATDFLLSESFVKGAGGVASGVVSSTFGIIGNIVIVFGVGLFFSISPSLYSQGIIKLVPVSQRKRTAHILSAVGTQLQWWFVAQLGSMCVTGILTYVGLSILHIPMALALAILAALMNFIPNFGPLIAAVPAVLVAFAPHDSHPGFNPALAGWTALLYLLVQMNDGWVVTPYLQQRTVSIPPALIIIGQFVFALLLGPIGLVLATPILTTVIALIRMVYIEDILGDRALQAEVTSGAGASGVPKP